MKGEDFMYMRISGVPVLSRISKRSRESLFMSLEAKIQEGYYQRGLLDSVSSLSKSGSVDLPSDIPRKYAAIYKSGYYDAR